MSETTLLQIKKMAPQLLVKDILYSIEFYKTNLGFDLEFFYDGFYAGIVKDNCTIHLKSGLTSVEERENRKGNNHLDIIFSTSNIENLYGEFLAKSVEFVQPLCVQPYGKEFYIADPDGYILAFLEEIA